MTKRLAIVIVGAAVLGSALAVQQIGPSPRPSVAAAEARLREAREASKAEREHRREQIADLAEATGVSFAEAARLRLEYLSERRLRAWYDSVYMADSLGILPGSVAR